MQDTDVILVSKTDPTDIQRLTEPQYALRAPYEKFRERYIVGRDYRRPELYWLVVQHYSSSVEAIWDFCKAFGISYNALFTGASMWVRTCQPAPRPYVQARRIPRRH